MVIKMILMNLKKCRKHLKNIIVNAGKYTIIIQGCGDIKKIAKAVLIDKA
jgi:hypothetical protein